MNLFGDNGGVKDCLDCNGKPQSRKRRHLKKRAGRMKDAGDFVSAVETPTPASQSLNWPAIPAQKEQLACLFPAAIST